MRRLARPQARSDHFSRSPSSDEAELIGEFSPCFRDLERPGEALRLAELAAARTAPEYHAHNATVRDFSEYVRCAFATPDGE